jgi:hypothetical protein
MRGVARITLFVHDRDDSPDPIPDPALLAALLRETPLVTHHADGSRTFVFDLAEPGRCAPGIVQASAKDSIQTPRGEPEPAAEGRVRSTQVRERGQC